MRTRALTALLAAAALALAGCGGDDEPARTQVATGKPDKGSADLSRKPDVKVPKGKAPAKLVKRDIVVGDGADAKQGSTVSVQYVGVSYKTGKQFDASWDRGEPFVFQLGAGQVIPGWDRGVAGMRVGGRRELIIPPDLAYGPQGSPPAIGPNETLVFVIDLTGIE